MSNIFDLFKKIESAAPAPITHAVVGLGNPGKEYGQKLYRQPRKQQVQLQRFSGFYVFSDR